jgi:hypothetical protein
MLLMSNVRPIADDRIRRLLQNAAIDMQFRIVSYGGTPKGALLNRLHESGVELNDLALCLFADARFTTSVVPTKVQVAEVSVASLGFPAGASFESLVESAEAAGLGLCPLELGPHLRLALRDQSEGAAGRPPTHGCAPYGAITVASPPLDGHEDAPKGFYLRRIEDTLWLRGYRSWNGHLWSPGDVLVFIKSREA